MKRLLFALAIALALLAPSAALAAGSAPRLTPIGRMHFPERGYLVELPGQAVLHADDVRVWENGRPVADPSFVAASSSGERLGVVLVVDASNSMRGKPLRDAFAAARGFAKRLGDNERVGLVTFNSRSKLVLAPEDGPDSLEAALSHVPAISRGTHVYDAVWRALDALKAEGVAAGSIVLLSDGADTGSRASAASVSERARAAHVRVFAIGLHSSSYRPAALRRLAVASGGAYAEAHSSAQLAGVYAAIGDRLSRTYLLRYRSRIDGDDRVRVRVDVAGGGSSIATYSVPHERAVGPFHRGAGERFWSSPASVAAVALLGAALAFVVVSLLVRARRSDLRERISHFVGSPVEEPARRRSFLTGRLLRRTERSLSRTRWWARFAEELEIAEIETGPEKIVLGSLLGALLTGVVLALISPVFCFFALAVPFGARAYCKRRLKKVRDAFAEQLPDNLQVLASALRAGHSFVGALSIVAGDTDEPSRREFQRVVADEQLGVVIEDSLREVARRMASSDLDQVALVAELQRQTGGNMAEVLDRVVETLRDRFDLRRLVKTLTAQGRMARWIVSLLPVFLLGAITVLNPTYVAPLFSTTGGQAALAGAAALVVAGSVVIKRIVDIKV